MFVLVMMYLAGCSHCIASHTEFFQGSTITLGLPIKMTALEASLYIIGFFLGSELLCQAGLTAVEQRLFIWQANFKC